ncbi:hypothetical protein PV721_20855 [Streptomyces sp. MB09-01]|uniref:hypothetical protein n=1 Tax=Streptomyces sp. MB09-01 TaxID=3028666 RepID=UPI0029ADD56A|nr:hypothetical protein [Streptomyces sp. MB09-01]MDX3536781.1 hypothetical protein [Streptomyces sp. MB09-01]
MFLYAAAQDAAGRLPDAKRWGSLLVGAVICLPPLYGALRLARMKVPARILAVLLHAAWSVLLLLDRLPWPAPDFGTQ